MPHIVVILLDSLRQDFLSCYTSTTLISPHIDRVAYSGYLFENAITPAINTTSVHTSLFTGLYLKEHKLHNSSPGRLDEKLPTLAEILQKHGYVTIGLSNNVFVGKNRGLDKGFRVFLEAKNFDPRYPSFLPLRILNKGLRLLNLENYQIGIRYSAELTIYKAIELLKEVKDKPFFLFMNLMETHIPHYPPLSLWEKLWKKNLLNLQKKWEHKKLLEYIAQHISGKGEIPPEEIELWKELCQREIKYADHQIGKLIKFLEKENLLNRTFLVITSDHGDYYGEHGLFSHAFGLHDTVIKVPLIIRYPGIFEGGKRITVQVQIHDLFPTIMEICKIPPEEYSHISRASLLHLDSDKFKFAFAETPDNRQCELMKEILKFNPSFPASFYGGPKSCIRTLNFKYISHTEGEDEFYNLSQDPEEKNNLIREDNPEKSRLREILKEWKEKTKVRVKSPLPSSTSMDEETRKRLKALGYI